MFGHAIRIVIPIGIAILVALWFGGSHVLQSSLETELQKHVQEIGAREAARIQERLDGLRNFAKTLAGNDLLVNGLIDLEGRASYLPAFFRSLNLPASSEATVSLVDYKGRVVASNVANTDLPPETSAVVAEGAMGVNLRELVITEPVVYSGSPEGAVIVRYPATAFEKLFGKSPFGNDFFLVDQSNIVIYSTDTALAITGNPAPAETVEGWLQVRNTLAQSGVSMVVASSLDVAFKPLETFRFVQFVGLVLFLSVSIGLIVVSVFIVSRPLKQFAACISSIQDMGGLDRRLDTKGPREVAELATAFNDMAAKLDRTAKKERALQKELRESETHLKDAIESISEGFALYDAEDRLVLFNTTYREGLSEISDILKPGVRFEEVIRALVERGLVPDAKGRIEDWVRERLHLHRTLGELTEQPFGDDQWLQTDRYRTNDGGTVIIRTDITERKRAEEEIRDLARFPEQNPDPVLRFAGDGALLYANPASARLMNKLKCGIGEPAPEDWRRMIVEALEAGPHTEIEYACGGLTFSLLLKKVPEAGYVNVYGHDITERKMAENAVRESEQRLQAITGNLFEGVLVVDANGHIFFANRSAETLLLGDGGDKLAGRDADDVFRLREGTRAIGFARSPFRQVAETAGTLRNDDAVFVTNEGKSLNVAYACSPLLENAKRRGAIISFRDIRELKEAQWEALQASKLASVGQLAGGIAHEINTPIQYIGDNLRFLGKAHGDIATVLEAYGKLGQAAREAGVLGEHTAAVETAVEDADLDYLLEELPAATGQSLGGVDQVSQIVLAMKDFSHPGTKEKAATDLNAALESTLTVCRNEWKHIAEVDVDLDSALSPVVCLAGEMNQVFLNLIVNGAHAIEASGGDGQGRIRVSTRKDGDWAEIRVADTGSGIPADIRSKIFDPFFTTKEVGRGTGQGLAICRDIVVNKHGGKIFFETGEGKGTTFVIRLPLDGQAKTSEAA